jgi:hypothetical protein
LRRANAEVADSLQAFAGVACLYGAGLSCDNSDNVYPSVGAGVQYVLKPQQGLVARPPIPRVADSKRFHPTARRNAARANERVESIVGNGEF